MTEPLTVEKFCFVHMVTGKKYLVGAYTREEASDQCAEIAGDYNFREIPIPEAYL
jgi:hypothetical protein